MSLMKAIIVTWECRFCKQTVEKGIPIPSLASDKIWSMLHEIPEGWVYIGDRDLWCSECDPRKERKWIKPVLPPVVTSEEHV